MAIDNYFSSRLDRLRQRIGSSEADGLAVDGLLVVDETNVRYLTGFTGDSTSLLVTQQDAVLLSDRRYEQQLAEQCPGMTAKIRGPETKPADWICQAVKSLRLTKLGLEDHATTWGTLRVYTSALPDVELVATEGLVAGLRAIKDEREIATIRKAIQIAERAFGVLRSSLRPGMSELDAAYLIESSIRSFGGSGVGFASIVASGSAGALPHYQPANRAIAMNDGLLVDWGAVFDGYTSDMTRTLSLGPVSPKMREIYSVVLEAHLAAIELVRPGVRFCDVDAAARNVIADAGYGAAFGHGLGHGIGLNVHEFPRLAATETDVLKPGMIITIEPGIYLPNEIGVRIEDDLLVTEDAHEVLCSLPKGLEENQVFL